MFSLKHIENGEAQKTWATFKTMFTEAHKDYMMLQNQGQHRFHTTNVTETVDTTNITTT